MQTYRVQESDVSADLFIVIGPTGPLTIPATTLEQALQHAERLNLLEATVADALVTPKRQRKSKVQSNEPGQRYFLKPLKNRPGLFRLYGPEGLVKRPIMGDGEAQLELDRINALDQQGTLPEFEGRALALKQQRLRRKVDLDKGRYTIRAVINLDSQGRPAGAFRYVVIEGPSLLSEWPTYESAQQDIERLLGEMKSPDADASL
jgi:hypothetical protein